MSKDRVPLIVEKVYEQYGKADADRRKLRGELAVKAWQELLTAIFTESWSVDEVAVESFHAADAMLAKLEAEGAL